MNSLSCVGLKATLVLLVSLLLSLNIYAKSGFHIENVHPQSKLKIQRAAKTDNLSLELNVSGQAFILELQPNKKLLRSSRFSFSREGDQIYSGSIQGIQKSWARVNIIDGLITGAFYDGAELYLIDSSVALSSAMSKSANIADLGSTITTVFKSSEVSDIGTCSDSTAGGTFSYKNILDGLPNFAMSNDVVSMSEEYAIATSGSAEKQVEIVIVADTEYVAATGNDANTQVIAEMNIVDGIFSDQLGVQFSITDIVELSSNGTLVDTDAGDLLVDFRNYIQTSIGNPGLAHLFTGKDLDGSTAGIAYVESLCGSYSVGVSQTGDLNSVSALIVAHEIGHNFGAPHDSQSGSACQSTGNGYLMNPSLNGSDEFSACSIAEMEPVIASASCLADVVIEDTAPTITSEANLVATVGVAYEYDDNNALEASGSDTISYELMLGPDDMVVSSDGLVSWTPDSLQVGEHLIEIVATNDFGSDTQSFSITVSEPADVTVLDFYDYEILSYGISQDVEGEIDIEDGGATLVMIGNTWKYIDYNYVVTSDTVLAFDFKSTSQGEVHGIGFDKTVKVSEKWTFGLYGNQEFGEMSFVYTGDGEYQHFEIPVGEFYTGSFSQLFFVMDHDDEDPTGNSYFKNIQVSDDGVFIIGEAPEISSEASLEAIVDESYQYDEDNYVEASGTDNISYTLRVGPIGMDVSEDGEVSWIPDSTQEGEHLVEIVATNDYGSDTQSFTIVVSAQIDDSVLDFNTYEILSYGISQDVQGEIEIADAGATLVLTGNLWKYIDYDYTVTSDTILSFDFKSTNQGEVHGIGLDKTLKISEKWTFGLHGSQEFGEMSFAYTGDGEYQHFEIPVGEFYTGSFSLLFFVMDHDEEEPTGNSYFKNIKISD